MNEKDVVANGRDILYRAQIIDQTVAKSFQGETQIILAIKVTAKVKNAKQPAEGTEECPQREHEILITLVESDSDRLRMAVSDLDRLGFRDDDIGLLHPEHPKFFSLVGKEVYVRPRIVGDVEYWNLAWPREHVCLHELTETAEPLKAKIAATRKRLKDRGAGKKCNQADAVSEQQQPK